MMKKLLSIVGLSLFALALAWCSCENSEDAALNEAIQSCLDKGWIHSLIHSQTAAYWECSFPSGVICEDQLVVAWECDYTPNLDSIDTPEKRFANCEENVNNWVSDIENWEIIDIEWEDEEEEWNLFSRRWEARYTKEWENRRITLECLCDFIDGSTSITYGDAVSDGASSDEISFDEAYDAILDGEFPEEDTSEGFSEDFPEWEFPEE